MMKYKKKINLSQNENPLGPSPLALKAITEGCNEVNMYPESSLNLKTKIATKLGLAPENIFISAGLVGALDILIRKMVDAQEHILAANITFVAYKIIAKMSDKEVNIRPLEGYRHDIKDYIQQCNSKTKLILIDNPSNPTGTTIRHDELVELLQSVPPTTLVVADEAYAEYVTDMDYPQSISLLKKYPNLVILRAFSKVYGLAGLRIGYTIAHKDVVAQLEKLQLPFIVNRLALAAAFAALDDEEYVQTCVELNNQERQRLYDGLKELGIDVLPSQGNFLFLPFATTEARDKLYNLLWENGIQTTKTDAFGDACALRISIGLEEDTRKVLACLA